MESSNLFSRPSGTQSVYETIRQHDDAESDVEERAGMTVEEDEGHEYFSDRELQDAMADGGVSLSASPDSPSLPHRSPPSVQPQRHHPAKSSGGVQWLQDSPLRAEPDERDNEVPPSLLVEAHDGLAPLNNSRFPPLPVTDDFADPAPPIPGPSTRVNRAHWDAARAQQPLYPTNRKTPPAGRLFSGQHPSLAAIDPKEKAMWRWVNVENLDNFLKDVYAYYMGNGFWSIMLSRALDLLYVFQKKKKIITKKKDKADNV